MPLYTPRVGDCITVTQTITEKEIRDFTHVSGDRNFLHTDPDNPVCSRTKAATGITGMIGHGAYLIALASSCISSLCGPVFLLGEIGTMRFTRPVPVGSTIHVSGEISKVELYDTNPEKKFYKCTVSLALKLSTGEPVCEPTSATVFLYI